MKRIYRMSNGVSIEEAIIKTLERDTGKTIFTMRIINELSDSLEAIVVFEDKNVLHTIISIVNINGELAFRMKGNYI